MGRAPCCDKANVKRGPWSPEEDATLKSYLQTHGTAGNWIALPQKAGLKRCGKSCRLRWLNYLRPDIKHGGFTEEEDKIILTLYGQMGSRWSLIASHLPGRTDNDVKNYWNTKLKKKLLAPKTTLENKNTPSPTHSTDLYMQKPESNSLAFWDSSAQNSATLPMLSDHRNGYDPTVKCAQSLSLEDPIHFSLSGIMEMSELGTTDLMNNHIVSPSQKGSSSISDSSSMAMASTNSCLEDASAINGMLMDSGFNFPYDPVNFHYYQNLSGFGYPPAADHDIKSQEQNQSIASYQY